MHILGPFGLLIVTLAGVDLQAWPNSTSFLEVLIQDEGFGGILILSLLFFYDYLEEQIELRNGICSKSVLLGNSEAVEQDVAALGGGGDGEIEKECCGEDEVFDVMTLREMVKKERERANSACGELEKERMAAASAAREAMAMILRLQSEKSNLEIEANQHRILVEKHEYDQDLIQSLHWIVMKRESERKELEDQLMLCRQELKRHLKGKDVDQFEEVDAGTSFFSVLPLQDGFD
ncbi:myosin-binding protein 3-like [Tripterygium wilfordii]|uniref:myosin-binding protein 3-like n=1 Tax=Tripterygium wilfordii TaxID=458696 RepID=UPI0018F836E3|nr:myosin-binding protein 3-like [Tripterygium wilfordii]